jgi:hypothetical protein
MPAITFRLGVGADGNFAAMNEVDQTAASRTDGWTVAKTTSGNSSEYDQGTKQAAGSFTSQTTTPKPASFLTGATANALKSSSTYTGSFDTSNWVMTFAVRAGTASAQTGRIRARVFTSPNADGSGATERTGATQVGTTSTALSTTVDVTTVVTWTPGAGFTLSHEYIFIVIAWEIVVASGSNSGDVLLRTGQSAGGTRVVTGTFTPSKSLVKEHPNRRRIHALAAMSRDRW